MRSSLLQLHLLCTTVALAATSVVAIPTDGLTRRHAVEYQYLNAEDEPAAATTSSSNDITSTLATSTTASATTSSTPSTAVVSTSNRCHFTPGTIALLVILLSIVVGGLSLFGFFKFRSIKKRRAEN